MCGIIGIVANNPVNQMLYDGLLVLQHRGQDAAGIATCSSGRIKMHKNNGLVKDVFHTRHMRNLTGNIGIGHVRYPTAGSSSVAEAQPFYEIPDAVKNFGNAKIFGPIPYLIIIPVIITLLMWVLMNRTSLGRYMLAYGNNVQSSELMGISSTKIVVYAHIISGLLAAIGGMLVVCRLQLGTPNIGDSWLLPSFAAPVIGGAILAGGKVDVIATAFGVILVAIISQTLVIFKIDPFFVQIFLGFMILIAVFINRYREYREDKRNKVFSNE